MLHFTGLKHKTTRRRTARRTLCLLLALLSLAGSMPEQLGSSAEGAETTCHDGKFWWHYYTGDTDPKLKIWRWEAAGNYTSYEDLVTKNKEQIKRVLLVWRDSSKPLPDQGNDGWYTYWTRDVKYRQNHVTAKDPFDNHEEDYCCLHGERCERIYFEKRLASFYTYDSLETMSTEIFYDRHKNGTGGGSLNSKEKNVGSKWKPNFRMKCVRYSGDDAKAWNEILAEGGNDSFTYSGSWEDDNYCGYQISEYGLYRGSDDKAHKDSKVTVEGMKVDTSGTGYSYIGCMDNTYDAPVGYDYDNTMLFIHGPFIAAYGSAHVIERTTHLTVNYKWWYSNSYEKFKQFRVYWGREVEIPGLRNLHVNAGQVYQIKTPTFLYGDVVIEPGGVLSIDTADCILDGVIKNYGTILLQKNAKMYPFLPDPNSNNGAIHCYGSETKYSDSSSTANGMPGVGLFILMPGSYYAQTKGYGGLVMDKGAVLENKGTMLVTRTLTAENAQVHNYSTGKIYCGRYVDDFLSPSLDKLTEDDYQTLTNYCTCKLPASDSTSGHLIDDGKIFLP